MIHPASRAIQAHFTEKGIKFRLDEHNNSSIIDAGFSIDNGPNVIVHFISPDDDNDVAVRVWSILSVKPDQREKILPVLNELNAKFRFLKFLMNDEGDVNVEYDLPVENDNVGPIAREIFIRFMSILDEAYPSLMRALWS